MCGMEQFRNQFPLGFDLLKGYKTVTANTLVYGIALFNLNPKQFFLKTSNFWLVHYFFFSLCTFLTFTFESILNFPRKKMMQLMSNR